jgi:hypothetical protein
LKSAVIIKVFKNITIKMLNGNGQKTKLKTVKGIAATLTKDKSINIL